MKIKLSLLCIVCAAMLTLSSCNGIFADPKELMRPPQAAGALSGIEAALSKAIGGAYELVYPTAGSHRNACITIDLNRDKKDEAVVLYSTTDNQQLHIMLLNSVDNQWSSTCDMQITGTGIERIEFADLCGDGDPEILIGSSQYNTKDKQLNVYNVTSKALELLTQESYTDMAVCDLMRRGKPQLMLCSIETQALFKEGDSNESFVKNFASARLISLYEGTDGVTTVVGTAELDPNITAFSSINTGILPDGTTGVYIDAYKGSDVMITELLYYNKTLVNVFYNKTLGETQQTRREMLVNSRDIDGDGGVEIPEGYIMPGYKQGDAEIAYYSSWKRYNDGGLETVTTGLLNTLDGYYLEAKAEWVGNTTLVRDYTTRSRSIFAWNLDNNEMSVELFTIRIFSSSKRESLAEEGYTKITEKDGRIYAVRLGNSNSPLMPSLEFIKRSFRLL